jgi:Amt family ammonium transporter
VSTDFSAWFFQFVFSATAATVSAKVLTNDQIVSGAVAERVSFEAYLVYSVLLTSFVYPVGTHWAWSDSAWLTELGFKDFAGSSVVHGLGGAAAFVACYFLGPRLGRFNPDGTPNALVRGHSNLLTAMGGMLLWFGFLAFNGGSTLAIISVDENGRLVSIANVVAKVFGVTIMSGCGGILLPFLNHLGGLSVLIYIRIVTGKWSVGKMINGSLAGLVSICAIADEVEFYNALIIGIIAGAVYELASRGLLKLQMDDPVGKFQVHFLTHYLDAIPVHLGGGIWGTIACGLFRTGDSLFYNGNIRFLGIQILGAFVIVAWTLTVMGFFFALLAYLKIFRVPAADEVSGLDEVKHDGAVYSSKSWSMINDIKQDSIPEV